MQREQRCDDLVACNGVQTLLGESQASLVCSLPCNAPVSIHCKFFSDLASAVPLPDCGPSPSIRLCTLQHPC